MAISWDELKDTSDTDPPISLFYGGAKLGKTTLASEWPAPYYCRTSEGERQSAGTPMKSFGVSESFEDVMDQAEFMLQAEHDRRTFVLDALDGLEVFINAEACARNGWADITQPGYGDGYTAAHGVWLEFIKKMLALKKAGFYVVLISHVKAKNVPGVTTDSYPRYMPNIRETASEAICAACDLIGFMHQRVSIAKEELGFKKTVKRGQGSGEINIAVQERPGFIAGSRYGYPKPIIDFKQGQGFATLNAHFPPQDGIAANDNLHVDDDEAEAA